jgi:hypothetical protein
MLLTNDNEVFETLVSKGWPGFYSMSQARWDVVDLREKITNLRLSMEEAVEKFPVRLFHRFNLELAKALATFWMEENELKFFAKEFMTRAFTAAEIKEVLSILAPPSDTSPSTRADRIKDNIDIINSVFP